MIIRPTVWEALLIVLCTIVVLGSVALMVRAANAQDFSGGDLQRSHRARAVGSVSMVEATRATYGLTALPPDRVPSAVVMPGAAAGGEPAALSPRERAYALAIARVSFNEAGASEPDLAMLHAIADARGRLAFLRRHSRCVMGVLSQEQAYARPGRCRWTRNLRVDARRPRGWNEAIDGPWSRMRPVWRAHLRMAAEYVSGARQLIVCPVTPRSWDGARWRAQIEARGWTVLDCKGTRNLGVVR